MNKRVLFDHIQHFASLISHTHVLVWDLGYHSEMLLLFALTCDCFRFNLLFVIFIVRDGGDWG